MMARIRGVPAFSAAAVFVVGMLSQSVAQPSSKGRTAINDGAAKPVEAGALTFKSVSVDFPDSSTTFPSGAGVDVVTANCTICHSPGMILNQPALSAAAWQAEVNKMRHTYKAPIDDADAARIVAYLVNMHAKTGN